MTVGSSAGTVGRRRYVSVSAPVGACMYNLGRGESEDSVITGAGGGMEALLRRRESACESLDLDLALVLDDALEDLGGCADDRVTCHGCQSWADHAHHPHNGQRITVQRYRELCSGAKIFGQRGSV